MCFREVRTRYERSEKGKARQHAYDQTDKGWDRKERYLQSPKGWRSRLEDRRNHALARRKQRKEAEDS